MLRSGLNDPYNSCTCRVWELDGVTGSTCSLSAAQYWGLPTLSSFAALEQQPATRSSKLFSAKTPIGWMWEGFTSAQVIEQYRIRSSSYTNEFLLRQQVSENPFKRHGKLSMLLYLQPMSSQMSFSGLRVLRQLVVLAANEIARACDHGDRGSM